MALSYKVYQEVNSNVPASSFESGLSPETAIRSIALRHDPYTEFTYVYRDFNLGQFIRTTAEDARARSTLGYAILDGFSYNLVTEWSEPLAPISRAADHAFSDQYQEVECAEDLIIRFLNQDEFEGESRSFFQECCHRGLMFGTESN